MNGLANLLSTLAGCVLNVAVVLLLAPFAEGLRRRLTARIQSRQGPPLAQPYFDLLKLLGKEDLEVGESPWVQRAAAALALTAVLGVACLLPLGAPIPLADTGDLLLLVFLLTLCSVSTLIAGLAAGSTYSLIGASREITLLVALEPLLAVALLVGSVRTGSLGLAPVLHASVFAGSGFPWSGLLLLGIMLLALPAFAQRSPFDVAEAETEIMEGPLIEYSGPKLALFKLAQMVRLLVYAGLVVALFVPWGRDWPQPLAWIAFWLQVLVLVLGVTVVAATHARYRLDQAFRRFAGLLALALVALALAGLGW
jgi:formate hydrogenlyase subunit 4